MPAAKTLSVVLITLNASKHLRECLESVAWAGEIVVLDGGSSDSTESIASEFHARFMVEPDWQGFGVQKNRALAFATGDWVLSLDADEVVTPALRAEIEAVLHAPRAEVFEMPRLSSFCGHWMRHGGWWPDPVTRLFRRGAARFSDDAVHERLLHQGAPARLGAHLLHYSYDDFEQALDKMNRYSSLGAGQAHRDGKRATPLTAWARGAWAFVRTYVLRLGLLDGSAGWMLALYNAQTTYYKYIKLWKLGSR
ncbi:MAG TPA: glycosyltransferase family 2 protein [Solimonas sp.]|nr:glycosyltransferase family 2 protein [Solimonas sp.]